MSRTRLIWVVNFVAFQLGWFVAVLGAAHGWPWLGPVCAAVFLVAHTAVAAAPVREAAAILVAATVGCAADSLLVLVGALRFSADEPRLWLLPVWIVALWALFASTLNVSLAWLQAWPRLAAVAGAIGGPLCYRAGVALGGTALPEDRVAAYLWIGGIWAMAVPLAAWSTRKLQPV